MLGPELNLDISVPEQTLGNLSFVEATPKNLEKWVADLPLANLGECSRRLFRAINELNRLKCSAKDRSQFLEILRSPIHFICTELSKHFLNSTITPEEKQSKIFSLVQSLHVQLAAGYKIIMNESAQELTVEVPRKNFSCAAHRFLTESGRVQLLSAQMYTNAPKGLWKEMNEVYRFSEELALLKYLVHDETNKHVSDTSIQQVFKRNLLLACCRPNQMRQTDIRAAWECFEVWSDYVEFGPKYISSAVFCLNLASDRPPQYKSMIHDQLDEFYFGFDTAELITRITAHLSAAQKPGDSNIHHIELPVRVSNTLLTQLHHSLGILTKRTFKRIASQGKLCLAVGLSSCHYYTSGQTSFQPHAFTKETVDFSNPRYHTNDGTDPWAGAFDAGKSHHLDDDTVINYTDKPISSDKDFPMHWTELVNTSPGGYCIEWSGLLPKSVQAGELLAIRENETSPWSIAVIRWIRHSKNTGTQLGIELLAPRARPCAVQQLAKTGQHSEFLRGLLLPELSSIDQPSTLVTPRLPFQKGNKVLLRFNGVESKCVLSDLIAETGSFSQFVLTGSNALDSKSPDFTQTDINDRSSEDDFDSLWPTL